VSGRVYLVGAGPGDPGLITHRALELLARADVILHDRLIPSAVLAAARDGALVLDVGKRGGDESTDQTAIGELLVEHARAGACVVRLKGGDPFVFGRGGEEAELLRAAAVPFEVVPGVTAGVAAPAYAGIPVTHRDHASAVALITGHEDPGKPEPVLDWSALAGFPGTLVLYMGVRQLPVIVERLLGAGRPAEEPAAVVERGTLSAQRTVRATLQTLVQRAGEAGIGAPAITVIGPVAALHDRLDWFAERPLLGRSVAVTRARAQASELAERLRELGATVVEAPAIRIVELPTVVPELSSYDLLCLTSPNGVRLLFEKLRASGRDARALAGIRVAVIGPGTARELERRGIIADVVPERFVAEGLVEALAEVNVGRVLLARARDARDVLVDALRERGAQTDVLELYETVAEPLDAVTREAAMAADYVTFTSSSTVSRFIDALDGEQLSVTTRLVSIGPITSETLRARGLEPNVEATRHDIEGLVQALLADVQGQARPVAPGR